MSKTVSKKQHFLVLGVMSGTSVDGLDLALVAFEKVGDHWQFSLQAADTVPYPAAWVQDLKGAISFSDHELNAFDLEYGMYIGKAVKEFLADKAQPDFIASHGHTVFHQPEKGVTLQVGNGEVISRECGLPMIYDFRTLDVLLGGQGAPLVPIGDRDLFHAYDLCLNLGGIANLSFHEGGNRRAFDICPINMALNPQAQLLGAEYDQDGQWARQGKIDESLLRALNDIAFCHQPYPKSLGLEDYLQHWEPIINASSISAYDKLSTIVEHVAMQIAAVVKAQNPEGKLLITGGGAFNSYFIERLQAHCQAHITIPDAKIIAFKEAIVFAYLGLLRLHELPNCLASVTGASRDNSGGKMSGF